MKKPKLLLHRDKTLQTIKNTSRNVEDALLQSVFSTLPSCSQMPMPSRRVLSQSNTRLKFLYLLIILAKYK